MICSEMNGKINLSDAAAIDMNKQLDIQTAYILQTARIAMDPRFNLKTSYKYIGTQPGAGTLQASARPQPQAFTFPVDLLRAGEQQHQEQRNLNRTRV